jgi:hypothetical protein
MESDLQNEIMGEREQVAENTLSQDDLEFSDFGQQANDEDISEMLNAAKEIDVKYQTLFMGTKSLLETGNLEWQEFA